MVIDAYSMRDSGVLLRDFLMNAGREAEVHTHGTTKDPDDPRQCLLLWLYIWYSTTSSTWFDSYKWLIISY